MSSSRTREATSTKRMYPLNYHPVQHALWTSPHRFNVVPAGRRSGKTEICGKRKIITKALQGTEFPNSRFGVGAPTRDQAKRIYWNDLKAMISPTLILDKSETDLSITLVTGTSIHVVGLDKPERIEGVPWDGFVLDEYGNMKERAWPENIRPALADRRGWCDFIGVPEGRNHYYRLHKRALSPKHKEWGSYHWMSADILPKEEIESAREDLDERTFKQEFEGSFVNFAGRVYYQFSEGLHYSRLEYNSNSPLIFCFDFNVSPGIAVVVQEEKIGKHIISNIIGEVYIEDDSNTLLVCKKLKHDWKHHKGKIYCYGDKTGGARGTAKVMGSDWDLITASLSKKWKNIGYDLPPKNPRERDRVNSVNTRLLNANGVVRVKIDPTKAPHVVEDFEGVLLSRSGTGEIDKKTDPKLTHCTDAVGYYIHKVFPVDRETWKRTEQQFWK